MNKYCQAGLISSSQTKSKGRESQIIKTQATTEIVPEQGAYCD